MRFDRLRNLVRSLVEAPDPSAYNQGYYGTCGTPGCAMGHYAARRDLQDAFELVSDTVYLLEPSPRYQEATYADMANHFEISRNQAAIFFGANGCSGADQDINAAITFIEEFIAEREAVDQAVDQVTAPAEEALV